MVIAAIAASFLALFQCRRIAVAHFFDTVLRLMCPRFLFFESFLNPRPSPKYSYRPSGVISAAFLVSVSLAESLVVLFLAGRDCRESREATGQLQCVVDTGYDQRLVVLTRSQRNQ